MKKKSLVGMFLIGVALVFFPLNYQNVLCFLSGKLIRTTSSWTLDALAEIQSIYFFFPETEYQNPSGDVNWYYYWNQTSATYGTHTWEWAYSTSGVTRFQDGEWKSFIQHAHENNGQQYDSAYGIDFFAHTCRHEERHRLDDIALWGAGSDRNPSNDTDGDFLPNDQEANLVPGHPYDNTKFGTYADSFYYGQDPLRDGEDYCLRREQSWTNGAANSEDWANPGKQY